MTSLPERAFVSTVPEDRPELRAGEVHLWMAELGALPEKMQSIVSADEWVRSSRFHFAADRQRYIATRALVRAILGSYLDEDPRTLHFRTGQQGKPAVANVPTFLRFNLSHSDDLLLLAVTFGREVGVDLEAIRPQLHYEMLAEHYFPPEEQWALRIIPPAQRCRKFFELWTRMEARLKACGRGLADAGTCDLAPVLTIRDFEPVEGYAAALAVEGDALELTCLRWQN